MLKYKVQNGMTFQFRLFAWLNIAIQILLPLTSTFTPLIVSARGGERTLQSLAAQGAMQTQVYTLTDGESTASVAKKYNMTVDVLRRLNQFRTFARDFDQLLPGDALDVPLEPLPDFLAQIPPTKINQADDAMAQQVAGYASRMGEFLSNNPSGDAATSMARGLISDVASGEVQQWLSPFGNARVKLDIDKAFSLQNSQLDFLVPLYEEKDSFVFTQSSIHRTDDRHQANIGFGYRRFTDDWMLGVNSFFDYDLSRHHSRLGFGAEYWRDFLKLGINTYHHLTDWKTSQDLEDYEERPANGWDIRTQAWLPSLPQLGGNFIYEQYYGDEVALFGRDTRQRNPYAVTAGVNYTPVPLLTLSAERRQGKAGDNDTHVGVEVNYKLGVPWQHQINPDAVAAMRSLAGSRHDFVERNNNIVLEYRKKDVIHLVTADLVTSYAGDQQSLGVSVTSKYGLERIDWSASSLIAAGGEIVQNGSDWVVILPTYQTSPQSVNTYMISGVAVDRKGNVSGRADTQVTVTQAAIDASLSAITPSTVILPADAQSQQELTLTVKDSEGMPVDIAENEISTMTISPRQEDGRATVSAFTRRAHGEYVMTITAGTRLETFRLISVARGKNLAFADVIVTADSNTARVEDLELVKDGAPADGTSQNMFRVIVVDGGGHLLPDQHVSLKAEHGTVTESALTGNDGSVTVPIVSTYAGETIITASINDQSSKTLSVTFSPDEATAIIEKNTFSILPEVSLADGNTQKTVTARVTDRQGNAIPGMSVTFSVDNGATLTEELVKTDVQGIAITTLTSTVAGASRVVASVNGQSTSKETTFIGNNATAIVASVNTTAESGIADGTTGVTFRALIKDQNGNPLSGIPVDWKSDKDSSIVSFNHSQTLTTEEGVAEAQVTSTKAYSDVVVTASTNASSNSASPFIFVADIQNPVIQTLSSNKQTLTANGTDMAELTVRITDTYGNPLTGVEVALSNGNKAEITPSHPVTGTDGMAFASLTTRHAGQVMVTASVNQGGEKTTSLQAVSDEQTAGVTVTADTDSATAGQEQPITLTATVVDGNNNPVSGSSIAWQTSHNQLSDMVSQTNSEGQATVLLTGTQAIITTVTAVLYNGQNGSAQVSFGPGEPASEYSQLSVSPQSITADGKSDALASLVLRDKWNNPVPEQAVNWSADANAGIHFSQTEKGDGVYQAAVTGTSEGAWLLTAQSGTVNLQTPLTLLANQNTAQLHSVVVTGSDTAKADGQDSVTIRAQVKDKNGNTALEGVAVGWDATLGVLSSPLSSTDENGIAEITLSSRTAGTALISAMLGGGSPVEADKAVSFTAGDISADKSSLSISPTNIVTEKESARLRVIVRDAEGNLLPGLKDKINAAFTPDLSATISAFSEVSPAVYEAAVSGKKVGTTLVSADVNGATINHTAPLTLRADNDSAVVKGNISVTTVSATVGDSVTYAAVLTDANENSLGAGIPVVWSANEGSMLSSQVTRTDDSGTARVTLSRQRSGTASVNLILPSGTTPAPDVIFSGGDVDENRSELTLTPSVIAAGKDTATLTLTLRDSYDNPLTGKAVSGQSDNGNVRFGESQESSNTPGRYTMTVNSDKAGSATLTVKVSDKLLSESKILTVKGDTDSWKLSSVTLDKTSLTAGDTKGVTYSAMVTDVQGNPLNNVVISWQLRGQAESYEPTSHTNELGIATTTVKSHTAGVLQMTAYLDANNHIQADSVTVVAGDIKNATFGADKTSIGSDGKDTVTLTTSLEDSFGNPVIGKALTIEGANSLAGFKVSAVQDMQNGRYVATGTATAQGEVTLHVLVDGEPMGDSVIITVGAITPDLRFDNAEQHTDWTKNFSASQSVKGMPEGLAHSWLSSNNSIATVDNNGKVTLLKSGSVKISVYTPGNEQYNPAMASYTLIVSKADPGLKAGTGTPIKAIWGDGKEYTITATYSNSDVQGELTATYTATDPAVVNVDNTGKLRAVKPGSTSVTISTQETDQYRPALTTVVYILDKATADLNFEAQVVQTTDEETFTLQKPVGSLLEEANIKWTSSNSNVVNVSDSGVVEADVGPGQARLTLMVLANDFYNASSAYYDVKVYSKPYINVGDLTYISKGVNGSSGTWTPVFTDDNISVHWSADVSNEFTKPERVTISLVDINDNVLATETKESPSGSNITKFSPNKELWEKSVRVKVVAKGYGKLVNHSESDGINVKNLKLSEVVTANTSMVVRYVITGSERTDNGCQETHFGKTHHAVVQPSTTVEISQNKTLIIPVDVSHKVVKIKDRVDEVQYPKYGSLTSSKVLSYSGLSHNYSIQQECWKDHYGTGSLQTIMKYGNETVVQEREFYWDGSGRWH